MDGPRLVLLSFVCQNVQCVLTDIPCCTDDKPQARDPEMGDRSKQGCQTERAGRSCQTNEQLW